MRTNKPATAVRRIPISIAFWLVAALASALVTTQAHAQAPGLLWRTNIGVRLFSVDAQTNVYANAGGTVIRLSGAGVPLQTNSICPIPGFAERDSAGNFYFAGNFDGTQDFGGITLVGGRISNIFTPPRYVPGYPSGYLAKYGSAGNLLWVVNYPYTGGPGFPGIGVTDLLLDTNGVVFVAYVYGIGDLVRYWGDITVARFNNSGANDWIQSGGYQVNGSALRLGGLTASNFCFLPIGQGSAAPDTPAGGKIDKAGTYGWFQTLLPPLLGPPPEATNAKPVIDDLGQGFVIGKTFPDGVNQLRKYEPAGLTELWSKEISAEVQWTLGRDPQNYIYLAGANGTLAKYDTDGIAIWSTNYAQQRAVMVVDPSGNRFLSFSDGSVARIASDPPAQAPTILTEPQPQTVFVGDNVLLSVTAGGTEPLRYFWRKDGTNIPNATNMTLSISPAGAQHSGVYSVVVTNLAGAVTSTPPAFLRVKSVQFYLGNQMLTNGTYVFSSPPTFSIRSAFTNGPIFHTLDGSPPSFASTPYSVPFTLSQSATLRAIGYSANFFQSEEADTVNVDILATHKLTASSTDGGIVTTNLNATFDQTNCALLPPDAVAWWRGEDNNQDAIGGHASTTYGGLIYTDGLVGRAFRFNGVNSQVRITDTTDLHFSNAMTIEAWVNPDENQITGQGGGSIISKWDALGPTPQSSFVLRLGQDAKAYFHISQNGASGGPSCTSVSTIQIGVWVHLAATYDGSYLRLYVNGVLEAQTPATGTIFPGLDDVALGAMVGNATPGNGTDEFKGIIDEPALYRRVLTAQEILEIYQAGACGKNAINNQPFTIGLFPANAVVAIKALPMPSYSFLYWLGDTSGSTPIVNVSMERDKTIHAVFGTTLGTTIVGNGQILLDPPGGVYPNGTVVRLTGVPQPGNYFGFWGNAATGNTNPLYYTITSANPTVSSIFGATPSGQAALTVLINGQGQVSANPRANAYATNQSVTLTAVSDSGQSFLNWSGDASGTQNPLNISMTQSKVITANFTSEPLLRVDRAGLEGLTPAGFRLTVVSDPPSVHQILGSTNLSLWEFLGTVTNNFGEAQFTDGGATNRPFRFYKAAP